MSDNIRQRVEAAEAAAAQQRAKAQRRTKRLEARYARDARERERAQRRVPEMLGMSALRRAFLTRAERNALREEIEARQEFDWMQEYPPEIDELCCTFREWATDNNIPCNVGVGNGPAGSSRTEGWLVYGSQYSHIKSVPAGDFVEYEGHAGGEYWIIPRDDLGQEEYADGKPLNNITVERVNVVEKIPHSPYGLTEKDRTEPPLPRGEGRPMCIEYSDAWYENTMHRLQEGMYKWALANSHAPFPEN